MRTVSREHIEEFFWNESERKNRFRIFNFLYDETNGEHQENGFSKKTFNEATKKLNELKSKIKTVNDDLEVELRKQIAEQELMLDILKKSEQEESGKDQIKKEWLEIVEKVHKDYSIYLRAMRRCAKKINYLIISEAPKLTIKGGKLHCNYIFDNSNDEVGFYRNAPYFALGGIETNPKAHDLIKLYVEKGVAFLDLVPIPLPELTTDLRFKWGFDEKYNVDALPRSIIFLEIAFEKFLKETNATFDSNTKIALMMPPKTGSGIIGFFMDDNKKTNCEKLNNFRKQFIQENKNENIVKHDIPHTAWRLHKAICTNGANSPQDYMIRNALDQLPKSERRWSKWKCLFCRSR
jgi:hypothetical protein